MADYYNPEIINAQDYYPFGMVEPGRQYTILRDSAYKFAFNGKLHDDDIYGKDNSYDYGMRFYNPRLGRAFSIDPLFKEFPMLSPYQFFSDNPIMNTDLDGKEGDDATVAILATQGVTKIKPVVDETVKQLAQQGTEDAARNGGSSILEEGAASAGSMAIKAASIALSFIFMTTDAGPRTNNEVWFDTKPLKLNGTDNKNRLSNTPAPKSDSKMYYSKDETEKGKIFYVTYTKTKINPDGSSTVYSGRTSGLYFGEQPTKEEAERAVALRDKTHQELNSQGYGQANIDVYSKKYGAIRGREQQIIDANGKAKSDNGTSGNKIRGVGKNNPRGKEYHAESNNDFGELYEYTGN